MFTPADMERMPKELEQLYADLELRIMQDIIRRIKINGEITRAADWQIYRLHELGESKRVIRKMIRDSLKLSNLEVKKLYKDAIRSGYAREESLYKATGTPFISFEENVILQQTIKAVRKQTQEQFKNITQSLGFAENINGKIQFTELADFYQKTLDAAMLDITSGAFDYNTVLKRTVATMTNSGLRTVDYASGWSNRIEVAVRRAVMTGVTQVTGKINEQNADELHTDYFEISWHADARPTHQIWQGKVYSKKELETVCGLGTVDGLGGANCRHTYYPFIPGISERTYTDEQLEEMNAKENTPKEFRGKQYTSYEASQKQRHMETVMRAQRQKIKLLQDGGASEDDIIAARCRYRKTMSDYVEFSKAMGIPQQRARIYGDGLGNVGVGKIKKTVGAAARGNGSSLIPKHDPPTFLETVDFSDKTAVKSVLDRYEQDIVPDVIENAIVVTKSGKVFHCKGSKNGVYPDVDLGDELKGACVTHNHPVGSDNEYSFSDADIRLFMENDLVIIRGIDEKYVYELTRDPDELDEHISIFDLENTDGDFGRHEFVIDKARNLGIGYRRWRRDG